jgi:hypothetical protein
MKLKLIALAAALLAGCADEQQTSSVPTVHKGESRAAVEARLGKPAGITRTSGGLLVCTYSPDAYKEFIPFYGAVADQTDIRVRYSHGIVVSWESRRQSSEMHSMEALKDELNNQ